MSEHNEVVNFSIQICTNCGQITMNYAFWKFRNSVLDRSGVHGVLIATIESQCTS